MHNSIKTVNKIVELFFQFGNIPAMDHPGEVTKSWRKAQNMSIEALAEATGVDKGTISRFENCGNFKMRVFRSICKALGHPLGDAYAEMAPAPTADAIGNCKEHEPEIILLESILHGTRSDAEFWRRGIIANLHAMSKSATEPEDDSRSGGPQSKADNPSLGLFQGGVVSAPRKKFKKVG